MEAKATLLKKLNNKDINNPFRFEKRLLKAAENYTFFNTLCSYMAVFCK